MTIKKKRNEHPSVEESTSFTIVVAGELQTFKFSLIVAAERGNLPKDVCSVLPDTHLLHNFSAYGLPITVLNTSGSRQNGDMEKKLKKADGIELTYACDRGDTFDKLRKYWLPYLEELELNKVPVTVIGCKADLPRDVDEDWKDFQIDTKLLLEDFLFAIKTKMELLVKKNLIIFK